MSGAISKQALCAFAIATAVTMSVSASASADCADVCQRYIHPTTHEVVARYRYMHSNHSEDGYVEGNIWFPPSLYSIDYCRKIALSTCNISRPGCASIYVEMGDSLSPPVEGDFVVQCPRRFDSIDAIELE